MAIFVFIFFVLVVIGLSLYLGKRAKTSSGYYAAGGEHSGCEWDRLCGRLFVGSFIFRDLQNNCHGWV